MKFWKPATAIAGALFIFCGIVFIIFCSAISDPEIEGESARTSLGTYFLSLIPISIGVIFFIVSSKIKEK